MNFGGSAFFVVHLVVYSLIMLSCVSEACCGSDDPFLYDRFPDDFSWATATAAYQIEGAWEEGGEWHSNIKDAYTECQTQI